MNLTLKGKLVIQTIFTESSHYLLEEQMNVREFSQMLFAWQRSLPQLLQTPVAKKAFWDFVEAHDVFAGKFKKPIQRYQYWQTPIKPSLVSLWNILWWLLAFSGHVDWEESIMKKVCVSVCVCVCVRARVCVCTCCEMPATQIQIILQMRTVSLIMRILHWFLCRVEANELPLKMQHQIQTRLLLQH